LSGIVEIRLDGQDALNDVCQTCFRTYRRHELPFNSKDTNKITTLRMHIAEKINRIK
jgi:hypothetical protein